MLVSAAALTLILGLGTCSQSGDWCPGVIAEIGLEKKLYQDGNHSWVGTASHMSDPRDGTFFDNRGGDRGVETYMLRYRYKIGE